MRDIELSESDFFLVGLILVSLHFVKSTLRIGESEIDNFLVRLTSASPHFVKSTIGAGDSENDSIVDRESTRTDCGLDRRVDKSKSE